MRREGDRKKGLQNFVREGGREKQTTKLTLHICIGILYVQYMYFGT